MVQKLTVRRCPLLVIAVIAMAGLVPAWAADEFSSGDKLRTLYSSHFTFTDDGLPQVTIEIMSGRSTVRLGGKDGLVVLPDGEGGATVTAGKEWLVTVEDAVPAVLREWIVVNRFPATETLPAEVALAQWKKRGHKVRLFEIGTLFAVAGEVVDTRELLVGIDPVAPSKGEQRAREISARYNLSATVHTQIVRRPMGTVVATSGSTTVRNASVLWFSSRSETGTVNLFDVPVGHGGAKASTRTQNRHYMGRVYVTVGKDGKLTAVNAVAADALLAGLVPSEMFPDAPMEALRAQAIAARTELLQKLGTRHFGDPFLLCSNQHCQVYSGAGHEHPRSTKAVESTRGEVLLGPKRQLVDARYSATCGGHTENNEIVWGGNPDSVLRGTLDGGAGFSPITEANVDDFLKKGSKSYCANTRWSKGRFRWEVRVDAKELSDRLGATYPKLGYVRALQPISRGVSGRIITLRMVGDNTSVDIHGELKIRRLLGGLRSSLFAIQPVGPKERPEEFLLLGGGFGHGVGMCQLGAIGRANKGHSAKRILQHYYNQSSVHKLY